MVVKHLPVLLRTDWCGEPGFLVVAGSGTGKQQSGLEDKCVFYVPGGTVTLWLAPYAVSFV